MLVPADSAMVDLELTVLLLPLALVGRTGFRRDRSGPRDSLEEALRRRWS